MPIIIYYFIILSTYLFYMNEKIIEIIKKNSEEIMQITFPFCEDEDHITSLRNTRINNLAHEIKTALDHIKSKN
jgi:predicted small metal-binding protein